MKGIAIQMKPKIISRERCFWSILLRDPGTKNKASMPKKDRPKGTKVAGASRMMMSINKNDEPQVIAIPRANSHSNHPNCKSESTPVPLGSDPKFREFAKCEFDMFVYYSRR